MRGFLRIIVRGYGWRVGAILAGLTIAAVAKVFA